MKNDFSNRATIAEIHLDAIAANLEGIKKRVHPARVMAVVKADGYGHGAVQVAKTALSAGASYLGVALPEEGIELRTAGITEPILVFASPAVCDLDAYFQYDLSCTLCDVSQIDSLRTRSEKHVKPIVCHLNVDTGMGRLGISFHEAESAVQQLLSEDSIDLEGLYTHFATSDEKEKTFAYEQLQRFKNLVEVLESKRLHIPLKHAANSGAILDMRDTFFDMVRPGVMLYGYYPSTETTESIPLHPSMLLKTRVAQVKDVPAGTGISYGHTFITSKPTRIITLPVGYADGYNRLLSNQGQVLINGNPYPVVGRVCMDLILVAANVQAAIHVGDEAVLMGNQGSACVPMAAWCEWTGSIPYEITCSITSRVHRVYKTSSKASR